MGLRSRPGPSADQSETIAIGPRSPFNFPNFTKNRILQRNLPRMTQLDSTGMKIQGYHNQPGEDLV